MDSLRGQLLIAPPHLADPNFAKTVVLIFQHDDEGAFGLILNRPSSTGINEIWKQMRGEDCARRDHLFVGGPVKGPLMMMHGDPSTGDIEIVEGVYCCSQAHDLEQHVESGAQDPTRFYAGYAGWGGGQLETELAVGSWFTTPGTQDHVFHTEGADLWTQVFRKYVDDTSLPAGFRPHDEDPSLN